MPDDKKGWKWSGSKSWRWNNNCGGWKDDNNYNNKNISNNNNNVKALGKKTKTHDKNKHGRKNYQTSMGSRLRRWERRNPKQDAHHQKVLDVIRSMAWAPLEECW